MCGNGYHLPSMASWQLYVLSHVVSKKDIVFEPERPLGMEDYIKDVSEEDAPSRCSTYLSTAGALCSTAGATLVPVYDRPAEDTFIIHGQKAAVDQG